MPKPLRPRWLKDKIEASARAAVPGDCPKCGGAVLVGPSDDDVFWTATVDAMPVDLINEAVARAKGSCSYDGLKRNGEIHLVVRDVWRIRAGDPNRRIHIDHKCQPGRKPPTPPTETAQEPTQWELFT